MRIVNYGGGVNSTALVCEAVRRGLRPDLIVFSDTGSERPETYAYLKTFNAWLEANRCPTVESVRWIRSRAPHKGEFIPLHEWCERENSVPSRAFGFSGCTSKWKQQPIDRFLKEHLTVKESLAKGKRPERWIGYDADEPHRAERMLDKNPDGQLWEWRAPLVEWDMGRDECLQAIEKAGLPSPGKSACWMCPSMKKREIVQLGKDHPDLLERALRMERRAVQAGNIGTNLRKGLGGRLNWGEFLAGRDDEEPEEEACGCYDGE